VDGSVRLLSRRGSDLTRLCPGVSVLGKLDIGPAVLDGEIVAFQDGQQSFEALQGAMRRRSGVDDVAFLAFDLLWLRGESLLARSYVERRELLESLELHPPVGLSPRFDDGEVLFEQTTRQATRASSRSDDGRSTARAFERASFVEPRVAVEIRYLERTSGGRLRNAAFRQFG
jgi:ATP-dependent DNA ligase